MSKTFNKFILIFIFLNMIFGINYCSKGGGEGKIIFPPNTESSDSLAITWFSFKAIENNTILDANADGVINDTNITIDVPFGTDVTNLIATFETKSAKVMVDTVVQTSGKTANNFSNPIIYRVYNKNNEVCDYTITVNKSINNDPRNVSASDGIYKDYIHVRWSPIKGAVSYDIYRAENNSYSIVGSRNYSSFADRNVAQGIEYSYKVVAHFSDNTSSNMSASNIGYISKKIIPAIPTGLAVTSNRLRITLTWSPALNASKYEIYRSNFYNGIYEKIDETDFLLENKFLYDDYSAVLNTDYYYKIKAVSNSSDKSEYSGYVVGRLENSYRVNDSYENYDGNTEGGVFVQTGSYLYRTSWIYNMSKDDDQFYFSAEAGRKYIIETTSIPGININEADTLLKLYKAKEFNDNNFLFENNNYANNIFSRIDFIAPESQNYYVFIDLFGGINQINYFYKVSVVESKAVVNIINNSRNEIIEMYVRLYNSSNPWGNNLIVGTGGPIFQETNRSIYIGTGINTYEIRLIKSNGQIVTINKAFDKNTIFDWEIN